MSTEGEEGEIAAFVQSVNRKRLAYLLNLRSHGHEVDDEQIGRLRSEIYGALGAREQVEERLRELQRVLALVDGFESGGAHNIKATLHRVGHIKMVMRPERNHARAHFHIEYKREFEASYAVDTLECLAGSMPKKYEKPILQWAQDYRRDLLLTWKRMNAGEDVRGLVVELDA